MDPPSLLCSNASRNAISTDVWSLQGDVRTGGLVTAVFEIIFILLGLPWNVLVLVAIIKERLYHQPTIILLMNLIISDIIVLAAVLPFSIITGLAGEYIIGDNDFTRCQFCRYHHLIFATVYNSSIFTISFMSVDRFIFIYKPLRYEKLITVPRTLGAVIVSWMISFIVPTILRLLLKRTILSPSSLACTLYAFDSPYYYSIYFVVILLPLAVIFVCNIGVVKIVLRNIKAIYRIRRSLTNDDERKSHKESLTNKMKMKRNQKQLHLMRVFGGLLCSNVITWTPFVVVVILFFVVPSLIPLSFLIIANLLFLSQFVVHPMLEMALISDVRDGMKKMCGIRRERQSTASDTNQTSTGCVCCSGNICDRLEVYNAAIFSS